MDAGKDDGSFAQIERALRSGARLGQLPTLYWIHEFLSPVIGNHLGITVRVFFKPQLFNCHQECRRGCKPMHCGLSWVKTPELRYATQYIPCLLPWFEKTNTRTGHRHDMEDSEALLHRRF